MHAIIEFFLAIFSRYAVISNVATKPRNFKVFYTFFQYMIYIVFKYYAYKR